MTAEWCQRLQALTWLSGDIRDVHLALQATANKGGAQRLAGQATNLHLRTAAAPADGSSSSRWLLGQHMPAVCHQVLLTSCAAAPLRRKQHHRDRAPSHVDHRPNSSLLLRMHKQATLRTMCTAYALSYLLAQLVIDQVVASTAVQIPAVQQLGHLPADKAARAVSTARKASWGALRRVIARTAHPWVGIVRGFKPAAGQDGKAQLRARPCSHLHTNFWHGSCLCIQLSHMRVHRQRFSTCQASPSGSSPEHQKMDHLPGTQHPGQL